MACCVTSTNYITNMNKIEVKCIDDKYKHSYSVCKAHALY